MAILQLQGFWQKSGVLTSINIKKCVDHVFTFQWFNFAFVKLPVQNSGPYPK